MAWVHAVIDVPADQHPAMAGFWSRVLGWELGVPWPGHPELRSFDPPRGEPYVHLQEIDGQPRVHLDLESDESTELLRTLCRHATSDEFVVTHKWRAGDIAFWDNRATQHRVDNDFGDARRRGERVTINGDTPR